MAKSFPTSLRIISVAQDVASGEALDAFVTLWQDKMADLLNEWSDTWDSSDMPQPSVSARDKGKFTKWPAWLLNYRHPNKKEIQKLKTLNR